MSGSAPAAPALSREGFNVKLVALILLSVSLAAVAQLTLKHGMNLVVDSVGRVGIDGPSARAVATSPWILTGLALFGLSAAVWLIVLSRAALSFAYPFAALTYVLILLFDRLVLHQQVPGLRWAGVACIALGIVLISQTPHA